MKGVAVHAVEAYGRGEVQLHSSLTLPLEVGDGQLHTLAKTPALNRRQDGPPSQPWHFGVKGCNLTYTHNTSIIMNAATKIIHITKIGILKNLETPA